MTEPFSISRTELEAREEATLAPYAMKSALSKGRRHPQPEHPLRTAFQRDKDRIIHCTAFRRLEYKTQVFVIHEGDYYRTRLTHTLEVMQIARTIARALRLNEDLTEAIALAHDLGHTPFAHSGEEALNNLLADVGGFEHNCQTLRVVDVIERRYPEYPGLNLTYEVRESLLKDQMPYPEDYIEGEFALDQGRLLEAQVVNAADEIAYRSHDADDGVKSGLLDIKDLEKLALWQSAEEAVLSHHLSLRKDEELFRCAIVRELINIQTTDLIENTVNRLAELKITGLEAVRATKNPIVAFSPRLSEMCQEFSDYLIINLYEHPMVARMTEKAKRIIGSLFEQYYARPRQLPLHILERIPTNLLNQPASPALKRYIADYIAGMTDRFAYEDYRSFFLPHIRL